MSCQIFLHSELSNKLFPLPPCLHLLLRDTSEVVSSPPLGKCKGLPGGNCSMEEVLLLPPQDSFDVLQPYKFAYRNQLKTVCSFLWGNCFLEEFAVCEKARSVPQLNMGIQSLGIQFCPLPVFSPLKPLLLSLKAIGKYNFFNGKKKRLQMGEWLVNCKTDPLPVHLRQGGSQMVSLAPMRAISPIYFSHLNQ